LILAAVAFAALATGHPRLLLDHDALARLRGAAAHKTAAWQAVAAGCERALAEALPPGYWGGSWAEAMADLALCWRGTGDARYGQRAVEYLRALVDDRARVGDAAGGDAYIKHDAGYGIRTLGVYAALGYDWLNDAPGMTPALRAHVLDRLSAWLGWYRREGYHRDAPGSNYFIGYATAELLAGLTAGDTIVGAGWLAHGRAELVRGLLVPFFRDHLQGGDFPEGWQYGELCAAEVGIMAEAVRTATGHPQARDLPWLREVVRHHVHALLPGGESVYDGGDHNEHPPKPSGVGLAGVALALAATDPVPAAQARFLLRRLPARAPRKPWLELLAERPDAPDRDPRAGEPTSLHMSGTGLSFARSDWGAGAVWLSFQAGPQLAEDHQHHDQGHFEIWRGADALLVDGGDYGSWATINHNTILVDDGGRVLNYPPNQGAWGRQMVTKRFGDDGEVMRVEGEFGDAYRPSCGPDCPERAVGSVTRTLVYWRPSTFVVLDRVVLTDANSGVALAFHSRVAPVRDGAHTSIVVGASRLDLKTVEPARTETKVVKQPTSPHSGPHRQDDPWGPIWRTEISGPRGTKDREFLHAASVGAHDEVPPPVVPVVGNGLRGVAIGSRAVLFANEITGGRAQLPAGTSTVVVVGPTFPHGRTFVPRSTGCEFAVSLGSDQAGTSTSLFRFPVPSCTRGKP
jgi:hypothetical protein